MTVPATRLLLVDGHNVAYRAFHALPPLTSPDGTPTNAVLGFARVLSSLRDTWAPTHACVAFDGGLPASRTQALAEYKAQRAPMPETLRPQFDLLRTYLSLSGVAHVRIENEEADDVLATLARSAASLGADVLVVSGDKDLLQIAGNRVALIRPQAPRERVGPPGVRALLGVDASQVPAWLALTGDTSDNIPGVPGIGPKTATALLSRFGSLDGIWSRIADVTPDRIRNLLVAHRAVVERNLAMMRLRDDLPGLPDLSAMAWRPVQEPHLRSFLSTLGLRSLLPTDIQPELF
jgi:DNA polymerase-1